MYIIAAFLLGACSNAVENPVAPKPDVINNQSDQTKNKNQSTAKTDLTADTLITEILPAKGSLKAQVDQFVSSILRNTCCSKNQNRICSTDLTTR